MDHEILDKQTWRRSKGDSLTGAPRAILRWEVASVPFHSVHVVEEGSLRVPGETSPGVADIRFEPQQPVIELLGLVEIITGRRLRTTGPVGPVCGGCRGAWANIKQVRTAVNAVAPAIRFMAISFFNVAFYCQTRVSNPRCILARNR